MFLLQITELLEHNDFLTAQSQKIREFYKYMAKEYPFLAFTSEEILANRLVEEFKDIPAEEVKAAVHKGWEEMAAARRDVQKKGEETLKYLEETIPATRNWTQESLMPSTSGEK